MRLVYYSPLDTLLEIMSELRLKVAEAKQRDVGRGIVRIGREDMK